MKLKPGTSVWLKRCHEIRAVVDQPHPHSRSLWLKDITANGAPMFDANEPMPVIEPTNWEPIPVEYVTWVLPDWAAETIRETLEMDARSHAFDPELREEIAKAYEEIEVL